MCYAFAGLTPPSRILGGIYSGRSNAREDFIKKNKISKEKGNGEERRYKIAEGREFLWGG